MGMTQSALLQAVPKGLYIDGTWRAASDGATLPVDDPATGKILAHVASATVADGKAALDAAVAAQHTWARTAPRDRGEILRRAYEAIVARTDDFAMLMTLETVSYTHLDVYKRQASNCPSSASTSSR